MNKNEKKLNDLFYSIFRISKNKEKKDLSNKNVEKWDSLNHISLILAIESKFGIKIEPEDAYKLTSYKRISNFLKKF